MLLNGSTRWFRITKAWAIRFLLKGRRRVLILKYTDKREFHNICLMCLAWLVEIYPHKLTEGWESLKTAGVLFCRILSAARPLQQCKEHEEIF